ncbi:hypothetical protein CRUP_038636, partial [Coryphaenoides rupestris]
MASSSSSALSAPRHRHNPVDSICRKLQTIRRCGDREPHSPFQIPKLFSSSSGRRVPTGASPRPDVDAILKKLPLHTSTSATNPSERACGRQKGGVVPAVGRRPTGIPCRDPGKSCYPPRIPATPTLPTPPTPSTASVAYSIIGTPGEGAGDRRGVAGTDTQRRAWPRGCSTPTAATLTRDSTRFAFSRAASHAEEEEEEEEDGARRGSPSLGHRTNSAPTAGHAHLLSYNLVFGGGGGGLDGELPCPALVVRRLSMGDPHTSALSGAGSENKNETMAEVSLICEEDLLDTIFHACDTQRRGKVFVSCIVDYLRHTTSRTSEDSGLEELCNMLDPERKDVSIDLDTYHAVMKEWIDDCRNNGSQQLAQREKMLKEEVEEMKATLSSAEEGRARASAHSKNMEKENQSLIAKITSLQEEVNFKVTMETDDLQARLGKLCDLNADLQKSREVEELKKVVEEYSSVTEVRPSLSLSAAYRLNQSISGSLQTELALAQSPLG